MTTVTVDGSTSVVTATTAGPQGPPGGQPHAADLDNLSNCQPGASAALAALTSTEVEIIDGNTSATATTLAAADRMVINDNGTMTQVALSDLVTFLEDGAISGIILDSGTF